MKEKMKFLFFIPVKLLFINKMPDRKDESLFTPCIAERYMKREIQEPQVLGGVWGNAPTFPNVSP